MKQAPNPQGKGLVPVMASLDASRPLVPVPAKDIEQISNELFTSLFVLESEFSFRPVVDKSYWLYRRAERFRLSLVGPEEWGGAAPIGDYVGECVLHPDMTWSLSLASAAAADPRLNRLIATRREALQRRLRAAKRVEEVLPVFEAELPFFQRVFAAGLAYSLGASLQRAGIAGLGYDAARKALPVSDIDD